MKTDLYNKVTDEIVLSLEQGVRPSMKPGSAEHAAGRITRPLRANGSAKSSVILRAAAIASGALLLAYDTPEGKIIYPGRVGTGMPVVELERLWRRLQSLVIEELPLRPHRCPTAATTSVSAMRSCSIAGLKGQADRCETTSDIETVPPSMLTGCSAIVSLEPPTSTLVPNPTPTVALAVAPPCAAPPRFIVGGAFLLFPARDACGISRPAPPASWSRSCRLTCRARSSPGPG
jgi:hypothetical protein